MTYSESQQTKNLDQTISLHENLSRNNNRICGTGIGYSIVLALTIALLQDLQKRPRKIINDEELGWRNKYNIHRLSGVSQKLIYKEYGIIEQLVEMKVIDKRPASSRWGQQKNHYRLNFAHIVEEDNILDNISESQ